MVSWQTAAHWPYVEAPFPFYLVFYDRAAAAGAGRAEARGGGPGTRRMALLLRAFRTAGDNRGS